MVLVRFWGFVGWECCFFFVFRGNEVDFVVETLGAP